MATYLGEKLHTNVQLPAILPGARGAALLWQGAAAATGLVLGAGQVYGGAAPFGLAFTMVCPPLYLFAAAGGVLISSLAFQPAVLGVKVIAALTATVAVRRLLQDKPNTKNAGIWAGCLALALVQAAVLFFAGGYVDLSQAAATGTTALLAAGSAWLMRRFPYREPRGLCLWLAIAAACLQRCARGRWLRAWRWPQQPGCAPPLPARWRRPLWSASRWRRPLRRPARTFATRRWRWHWEAWRQPAFTPASACAVLAFLRRAACWEPWPPPMPPVCCRCLWPGLWALARRWLCRGVAAGGVSAARPAGCRPRG